MELGEVARRARCDDLAVGGPVEQRRHQAAGIDDDPQEPVVEDDAADGRRRGRLLPVV